MVPCRVGEWQSANTFVAHGPANYPSSPPCCRWTGALGWAASGSIAVVSRKNYKSNRPGHVKCTDTAIRSDKSRKKKRYNIIVMCPGIHEARTFTRRIDKRRCFDARKTTVKTLTRNTNRDRGRELHDNDHGYRHKHVIAYSRWSTGRTRHDVESWSNFKLIFRVLQKKKHHLNGN